MNKNTKPSIWWKCLLKIPAAKNMLYWEKKGSTHSLNLEKKIKLKTLKLRYLIKRTCESALLCIPEVQLTFSSLNHAVQCQLSRFHQYKCHLQVLTIEKGQQWGNFFQLLFFPQCKPVERSKRDQELTIWSQPRRNPGYWGWILKVLYRVAYKFVKHGPVDIMGQVIHSWGVRGHVLSIVGSLAVAVDSIHLTPDTTSKLWQLKTADIHKCPWLRLPGPQKS